MYSEEGNSVILTMSREPNRKGTIMKRIEYIDLEAPREGTTYTLDDTYLENKLEEQPPVKYWLLMNRIVAKTSQRLVHEITAVTRQDADAQLTAIAEREDVTLIEEMSGKPLCIENHERRV